jgi:hypothetical protein
MKINDKGQCPMCLIKPLVYKRPTHRLFCHRCCREFDPATGEQNENWAWSKGDNGEFKQSPALTRSRI